MSMQEEGFVQLPLSKYHELLEQKERKEVIQEAYNNLIREYKERHKRVRESLFFHDSKYPGEEGLVINITVDEVMLLEFLGVHNILNEELNKSFSFAPPPIQRIETYVKSSEKNKQKFLAEKVNNRE